MELNCPVCREVVSIANDAIDTDWACPFCQEMFVPRAVLTNVGHPKLTSCPDCGHIVSRRAITCPKCDAQLGQPTPSALGCPDCGEQVSDDVKICPNCGAPILLRPIPTQPIASQRPIPPTEPTAPQRPIPLNWGKPRETAEEMGFTPGGELHWGKGAKRNNPWALTGFILGCCSILLSIFGILWIAAVVCGIVGVTTFDDERHTNKWMGPVGLVLGVLGFIANMAAYGHWERLQRLL